MIADYLSENLVTQLKTFSEDSGALIQTFEWIEDIDITDTEINVDESRTNKEKATSIANKVVRHFLYLMTKNLTICKGRHKQIIQSRSKQ